MKFQIQKIFYFFSIILILTCIISRIVYSANSTNVNATVKISVCGNGIIENGEDCEGNNLNGKTCESLGYASGTLSCDISCSFNTSNCIVATPTPTLIPTLIPTNSPTTMPNSTSENVSTPTETPLFPTVSITPTQNNLLNSIIPSVNSFPQALFNFGADKNGMIEKGQLYISVKRWVNQWQNFLSSTHVENGQVLGTQTAKKCDINNDGVCDLVDLSVMLYYVQP